MAEETEQQSEEFICESCGDGYAEYECFNCEMNLCSSCAMGDKMFCSSECEEEYQTKGLDDEELDQIALQYKDQPRENLIAILTDCAEAEQRCWNMSETEVEAMVIKSIERVMKIKEVE